MSATLSKAEPKTAITAQADKAMDAADAALEAVSGQAATAREALVQSGDRLAKSLHDQADGAAPTQARVLTGIADGITQAADTLRNRSVGELVSSAQDYARRHPGAVAACAAVAGFALARFLRPSASAAELAARDGIDPLDKRTGRHA